MNLRPVRLALAVVLGAIALATPLARAACSYFPMASGTTYLFPGTPQNCVATTASGTWSVFATRAVLPTEDWDLKLFQNTAADPTCVTNLLASSAVGVNEVDVIVGDWTHNAAGDYYPQLTRFSGGPTGAMAGWRSSAGTLAINGMFVAPNFTASDLAMMWTIDLTGGVTYSVDFDASKLDVSYSPKLLIYRNPCAGSYFAGRGGAIATLLASTTSSTFTAPATGTYAMVFVNDGGGHGQMSLSVGTCDAITLAPGVPVTLTKYDNYLRVPISAANWDVVAVKSDQWARADYYTTSSSNPFPVCFGSLLATASADPPNVTGIAGNYHLAARTTYGLWARTAEGSTSRVEWSGLNGTLAVDGAPVTVSTTAEDFVRTYEVTLVAGLTYVVSLVQPAESLYVMSFAPDPTRPLQAINPPPLRMTDCYTFTATYSGAYAFTVVNASDGPAAGTLGISTAPCVCPTELFHSQPKTTTAVDSYWRIGAPWSWNVVATRGTTTSDDWDLALYASPAGAAAPACFGNLLQSSSAGAGTVDLAAVDYDHSPRTDTFLHAHRYSGSSGIVEVATHQSILTASGPFRDVSFAPSDLVIVHLANLTWDTTYQFETYVTPGSGGKFLIFENPGSGAYAVGRSQAKLVISTNGVATYKPATSGLHAIVFVNDAGTSGSYRIRYGGCAMSPALASDTPVTADQVGRIYPFTPVASGWSAIGVRAENETHAISVWNDWGGVWPACGSGLLGASAVPSPRYVNLVVGDFWHNATREYLATVDQTSGTANESSSVEWSNGTPQVVANDNAVVTGTLGGNQVLKSYSTYLLAGRTFRLQLSHTGTATLHALLFRNLAGGTYWAPRDSACLDVAAGGYGSYTCTQSGWYGIVVVDDDAVTDTYTIGLWTCWDAEALASGVTGSMTPAAYVSFTPTWYYWTAIGVRSTSDWDIVVNANPTGADPPACQSGILASSTGVGVVDLVVGDFNSGANPLGTYYAHLYRFAGTSYGVFQWDGGHDLLATSGGAVRRTFATTDVVDAWDVRLVAGQAYNISFTRAPGLDAKVLLFRNAAGGAYWAGRSAAVYTASGNGTYTAPSTGYYGLVVVNDNGAAGQYDLGVSATGVGAPPTALPSVTALHGVSPNPARGGARVAFALHAPARVRIEAIDLAGRVVARIEDVDHAAGEWSAAWDGRTIAGQRAAPGLYLVRMSIDDRVIGQRKLALVD